MSKKQSKSEDQDSQEGITVKKSEDFSEWFTQITQRAELCDLRYNVKGFIVYRPWSVFTMKKMFRQYERVLEKKKHNPLIMPILIPESNFHLEASHVEGFTPEVFWVTEHGAGEKFEERLALRPTSETAFYQMFALWIRSYNDLPLKTYQSGPVFRYESKATRPFFRGREFHWIETHNAFASEEDAMNQVLEDMQTTKEMLTDHFGIPFIFFQRPEWDKFAGAVNTFAADALMPSGKVLQLPSTHMLGQNFSKPFNVKFTDRESKEQYVYITCYGPAISRIYGGLISLHGDDKGLVLPFDLAPRQVVIIPILFEDSKEKVLKKAEALEKKLKAYRPVIDASEKSAGWKFNHWEMKGVPIRIEIGPKDVESGSVVIARRDTGEKKAIKEADLLKEVEKIEEEFTKNLTRKARSMADGNTIDVKSLSELKKAMDNEKIARVPFCSVSMDGKACAEKVKEESMGDVRGTKFDDPSVPTEKEKCIVCSKPAKYYVYIARSY